MSSLTFAQAYGEMATIFKTAWDVTGKAIWFENIVSDRDEANTSFCYFEIQHQSGRQASMGAATGNRMFRRRGNVTVQIHALITKGLQESQQLAKVAADAFEGKSTPGGVWFRNVRMLEVGRNGTFFITNVIADFEYDEIK